MTFSETMRVLQREFQQANVGHADKYFAKLAANRDNELKRDDLLVEAQAALTFAAYGIEVTMRESPDLELHLDGTTAYAEVKRFRLKQRDILDEARLEAAFERGHLVDYGYPVEDGRHAWEQVLDVLTRKCRQFKLSAPLIIVMRSDSRHCIEENDVMTAANIINERLSENEMSDYKMLQGVLFFSAWRSISKQRSVYFYRIHGRKASLSKAMVNNLENISETVRLP